MTSATDNRTTELLPCPFCGGEAVMKHVRQIWEPRERYWAACQSCHMSGKHYCTEAEAIEAWNTRPVETCILEGSYSMDGWLDEREPIWTFDFSCGHSFTSLDNEPPAHCPECGRKVSE